MQRKVIIVSSIVLVSLFTISSGISFFSKKNIIRNHIIEYKKNNGGDSPSSINMYEYLERYSDSFRIPKHIIYNIAFKETGYRGPFHWTYKPGLTSSVGAVGPMQVMPATANMIQGGKVSVKKLKNNIEFNIGISSKLLSKLFKKYGDWEIVCGCYNTGRPIVNKYAKFCSENEDYQKNWVCFN